MGIKKYRVDLNPNLFNNVYWHLAKAFQNHALRFIWVYGGSSASKTYSVVQLQIVSMMTRKGENALILRKYAVDIKDSIYADFKNIIEEWGLGEYFLIQQNFILCKLTNSYVRFRGLDDSEKIKGISNFKRVILEEINQFEEVDFKQVKKRLRGKVGQQIIGIFNPISEEHWIKTNVFDQEELIEQKIDISGMWVNKNGDILILKTNYLDNRYIVGPAFVDHHVIADFEKDKINDSNYYRIYGLGEWGKIRTGGEFWKDFNSNIHTTKQYWNEALPIHLSFDENVNPYLTCLVWQIIGKTAIQIDEICLSDPRNRRKDVCNEFMSRYPQERVQGLFIYGDRTSVKEDTGKEKGENFFTDIENYLRDYRPSRRVQSVNPSIVRSAGFINETYAGRTAISILINERCRKSLYDYQYSLEDSDGTLKKTKKTHPITKVSYEEFGHPSDAKRYFITMAFASEYENYLRGGKKSNIRLGKNISKNSY